ncbi:hypothetical protein HanRHA438_Chr02g0049461 [Helianthus annuus]|nr:hypothetical protein HanRHA438_Chr02g0049461 [Helianthus annuus]
MTLKISSRAISYIDFICINFVWIVACIWLYFMYGNKLCDDKVPDLIHHTYTIW